MTIKNEFMKEGGALMLAAAILERAKCDYIAAICANDKRQMKALERFFLSGWGQELSLCKGEVIIEICQKIAAEKIESRDRNKRDTTSRKK